MMQKIEYSNFERSVGVFFTIRTEAMFDELIAAHQPIRKPRLNDYSFLAPDGTRVRMEGGTAEEGDMIRAKLTALGAV